MKVLVKYDDNIYLVESMYNNTYNIGDLWDQVNEGRYQDECQDKEQILQDAEIICYMTDDSEIVNMRGND